MPIAYDQILAAANTSGIGVEKYLRDRLPWVWRDAYLKMSTRASDIVIFKYGAFEYIYDIHQSMGAVGGFGPNKEHSARVIAVIGNSSTQHLARDNARLKGMLLTSDESLMGPWDRGHYIGHKMGGRVDGNEANVFLQLRSINRGKYRVMEAYCAANPGVLCFSRPIYGDSSAQPMAIDFGVLKSNIDLWVQTMPNRN